MKQSDTVSASIFRAIGLAIALASVILSASIANASSTPPDEERWMARKNDQNLQLYTREVADSEFLAVKVTALISAPMDKVADVFGDGNGCSQWQAMCKASTVVKVESDDLHYIHLVLDLPWPFSDRDMVMSSTSTVDPETQSATVQLVSAADKIPLQDYVRARSNGSYTVQQTSDGKVKFTYIMHSDLGGEISPTAANSRLVSTTFEDIKRLVELAER